MKRQGIETLSDEKLRYGMARLGEGIDMLLIAVRRCGMAEEGIERPGDGID